MTPSAASPIVPLTKTRSPGLAPARRTIVPSGTLPNMAIETITGPGVRSVSPPNSGQPNRTASPRSPCANPSSQSPPVSFGSARDNRKPSGRAPLAARSDRFTRSALLATVCAASSGKKWTPPTMASVLSTRSQPAGGLRKAASSAKPRAPGWVASGSKNRAIRRSSADKLSRVFIVSPGGTAELGRAQTPRKLVEHSIDHASLVAPNKSSRDIGILRHDDTRRHVVAVNQLIGAGAQRRAQNRFDTFEWPAFRQRLIDHWIKLALFAHHARNDIAKERRLRGKILRTLNLATDPVALEFGEDFVKTRTGKVHLIKRLHGCKPGRTAPVRLARVLVVA